MLLCVHRAVIDRSEHIIAKLLYKTVEIESDRLVSLPEIIVDEHGEHCGKSCLYTSNTLQ